MLFLTIISERTKFLWSNLRVTYYQNKFSRSHFCMNIIFLDAAVFDMEYSRWLEEHHRLMCELRNALTEHFPENDLRIYVENCVTHYDEMMNLKSMLIKSDVFHLISGMWKTPAERCFIWMGDFRPSELIKVRVYALSDHLQDNYS